MASSWLARSVNAWEVGSAGWSPPASEVNKRFLISSGRNLNPFTLPWLGYWPRLVKFFGEPPWQMKHTPGCSLKPRKSRLGGNGSPDWMVVVVPVGSEKIGISEPTIPGTEVIVSIMLPLVSLPNWKAHVVP